MKKLSIASALAFVGAANSLGAAVPERTLVVAIIGQSNEAGAGESSDLHIEKALQRDPIPPLGGMRSMWPTLEEIAAQRGVRMWVWNSAVGSTSIAHSWAGTLRDWQRGLVVVPGAYVRWNGRIYKNLTPNPQRGLNKSIDPPVEGATTDGLQWQDLGPGQAGEVSGRVFRPGDRLFDPNGFVKRALEGLSKQRGKRWVFISIGQGDAGSYWNVSREQYREGLIAVTDASLAAGARVAIGFTSATAKSELEAAYQQKLMPGWRDALAHYSGDNRIIEGANLRTALGALSVTTDGSPGVRPDEVHMNNAAYLLASRAWAVALTRASILPPPE